MSPLHDDRHRRPSGLQLPAHLPAHLQTPGGEAPTQREREWLGVGAAHASVKVRAVDMGRRGWRHEVQAEYLARDDATGRGVVRRDVLWLVDFDRAHELAELAVERLRQAPSRFTTLDALAAEHAIPVN